MRLEKTCAIFIIVMAAAIILTGCQKADDSTRESSILTVQITEENNAAEIAEEPAQQENQSFKTSTEQSQVSADVSSNQSQTSADENSEQAQTSADASNNQPNATSKESAEPWPLSMEESYMSILLADGMFISTDLQKKLNLAAIKEVVTDDDSVSVAASKFAIVDLDGDGEAEIVLWLQINGISDYGFEILQYREGAVYGYTLPYRAFMDLKTDGTFLFSGGSADSGVGKLEFSENGYMVDQLHESDSDNAMRQQEEKSDVKWYDLSVDGVNTAFENMF